MSSVLGCDPDELDASAAGLRRVAVELEASAAEVAGAAVLAWTGLAALEHTARRRETAGAVDRLRAPLLQAADALSQVAAAAREQGDVVRRHARLRDEVELERSRLRWLGPPAEPAAAAHWAERLTELEAELSEHRQLVEAAEAVFELVQRREAWLLEELCANAPQLVRDLVLTGLTTWRARQGWHQAVGAYSLADSSRRLARVSGRAAERTRAVVQARIGRHAQRLGMQPGGLAGRIPGVAAVAGRAVPVVALADAARGAVTGGGYDGWRGGVTRGLGVIGVMGAGTALVTGGLIAVAAAPAAAAIGMSAAAVYQLWVTGNWLYDHREQIGRLAGRAWSGVRTLGGKAWSGGRRLLGRARDRASSGLRRLRERLGSEGAVVAAG